MGSNVIKKTNKTKNSREIFYYIGSAKYNFFLGNALKKLLNIFPNFFFYLKVQSFRLIMENNLIQLAASDRHALAYTTEYFPRFLFLFESTILPVNYGK